jgi:hypothetical protein
MECQSTGNIGSNERLIQKILLQNPTVRIYLRERLAKAVEKTECFAIGSTDTGMNLAILTDVICTESVEWHVLQATYKIDHLQKTTALYNRLVYPLIFWNGVGCVIR